MHMPLRLSPNSALFLDFDGTLVDFAPQPEAVRVDPMLPTLLSRLHQHLHGAVAIVSSRCLKEIDTLLAPLCLPAAGEQGSERREADGKCAVFQVPDLHGPAQVAKQLAAMHQGLRFEQRANVVALHYRHAPSLESLCMNSLTEAVRLCPELDVSRGKYLLEVKAARVSKATAIGAFMSRPPFVDRQPIFVGDDQSDESGFAAVQANGGIAIKVGGGPSQAKYRCPSPTVLRRWLSMEIG